MSAAGERLVERLRRVEQQIRSLRDLHASEQRELAQRMEAIAQVHEDEMQLILDELADIASALVGEAPVPFAHAAPEAVVADPAAASPKRARWLAEQERRAHLTRRDLLRGRDADREGPSSEGA